MLRFLSAVSIVLVLLSVANAEQMEDDFAAWLTRLRLDAAQQGVSAKTIEVALRQPKLLDSVIKADRNQPEFKRSLDEYVSSVVSEKRVAKGRQMLQKYRRLLKRIGNEYQVQPRFIVALWGIESYYGRHSGKIPIIDALVTLAYDGRRSAYFRRELFNALRILDAGHVRLEQLRGSWAGAMGQVQFMPSSFLRFAVDGNGDGRIDLWKTPADYLSSAANYLAKVGWQSKQTWGRQVLVPPGLATDLVGLQNRALLSNWRKFGVRQIDGQPLPNAQLYASLLQPEGAEGKSYLVYENYRALLRWNRSNSFAIAVGMLADRLAGGE